VRLGRGGKCPRIKSKSTLNGASEKVGQIKVDERSTSSISSGRDSVLLHV
jgi:hypothetical protein